MNQDIGADAAPKSPANDVPFRDKLKRPGNILIIVFILNLLAYMVLGVVFGGWALAGNVVDEHYYLYTGSKSFPASVTSVSRSVYMYSLWHGYSHPVLLMLYMLFEPKRKNRFFL